jgi:hypothetical protein
MGVVRNHTQTKYHRISTLTVWHVRAAPAGLCALSAPPMQSLPEFVCFLFPYLLPSVMHPITPACLLSTELQNKANQG